jgi:DNA-binding NarL/FixJ family response regulator
MTKREKNRGAGFNALTIRERELLYPLTEGKPNKLIAEELGVSRRTIEAHRANIFLKMDVQNAVQLMRALYSNPRLSERMTAGSRRQTAKKTVKKTATDKTAS